MTRPCSRPTGWWPPATWPAGPPTLTQLRIEHWQVAAEEGVAAARSPAGRPGRRPGLRPGALLLVRPVRAADPGARPPGARRRGGGGRRGARRGRKLRRPLRPGRPADRRAGLSPAPPAHGLPAPTGGRGVVGRGSAPSGAERRPVHRRSGRSGGPGPPGPGRRAAPSRRRSAAGLGQPRRRPPRSAGLGQRRARRWRGPGRRPPARRCGPPSSGSAIGRDLQAARRAARTSCRVTAGAQLAGCPGRQGPPPSPPRPGRAAPAEGSWAGGQETRPASWARPLAGDGLARGTSAVGSKLCQP